MDSDTEDDILGDDSLMAPNDIWDEELNDDLLRSDEDDPTTSCQGVLPASDLPSSCDSCKPPKKSDFVTIESVHGPQEHVYKNETMPSAANATLSSVASHLGYKQNDAPHVAVELRRCTGEQQTEEELDHVEVLDIQINGPFGDEFQEQSREAVRQQEVNSAIKHKDEENRSLHFKTERKASATPVRSSGAASKRISLTEALDLCEEARPVLWNHVHRLAEGGRSGTHMDTQLHACSGFSGQTAPKELVLQASHVCAAGNNWPHFEPKQTMSIQTTLKTSEHPQTEAPTSTGQSPISCLRPHLVEPSAGATARQVPLTSAQSLANPGVDPSSLQGVADSSKPLCVEIDTAGIHRVFPGQHMFGQQHHTSALDSSLLLHGPAPQGASLRPGCSGDPWRPGCSSQRNLGLSNPKKTHHTFPGRTSQQPVSSHTTHLDLQEKVVSIPVKPKRCVDQYVPPDQGLQLPLPETQLFLHPKPQNSHSSASSVQTRSPAHPREVKFQSNPRDQPALLCCAVIRPRMVHCSCDLSDCPVLAHNSSFINAARPTPTPAALVRPVARGIATGMPDTASQQPSARAAVCARTVPEPGLAEMSQGQEVKEEPQSPLSLLSEKEGEEEAREERQIDRDDDALYQYKAVEEDDGVSAWYRLQLEKQKCQREKLISQKEKRRYLQAQNKRKQRQEKLQKVPLMRQNYAQEPQQSSQGRVQAERIQKPPKKPTPSNSNPPQLHLQCSFDSESYPDLQLCQHLSAVLPPPKPPSKSGYPPAPLAQCPAAPAPVRRAVMWHDQSFHGHCFYGQGCLGHNKRSGGFSEELRERHERKRRIVMKGVMKKLPSKVRVVKYSSAEEEEDSITLRFPARVSSGSRVVTFTQAASSGPHRFRQHSLNLGGWTSSN